MPNISEFYPSKYLSAADLKGQDVTVTIERVETEQFEDNGRKVPKPVVYFKGSPKAMIFNKTNSTSVVEITGQPDTDHWGGSRICLYPTSVQFGAKMTEAIRVKRPPEPSATVVPSSPPAVPPVAAEVAVAPVSSQADEDLADEIPWN